MKILNSRPWYVDFLFIVLGTGIMALAIQCIFEPIGLVTGGFTGIAIIIRKVTAGLVEGGIPLWLTNIVLNIPVFLFALKIKGKRFIGRTVIGTVLLSFWLYIIPQVDLTQGDYMLSAIFGGVITGIGIGFVLLAKATTGGTDMVSVLIQHKVRHYSVVQILQVIDGAVVLAGLYVFGLKPALYAVVAIFITSKVSDALMEGMKYSKAAFIITDRYQEVADAIMTKLDRGLTGLDATGMYSGDKKTVLYCVVSKKEIVDLKDIVAEIDTKAFVIVTDAREVLGEGFLEY
ncbi:MAG: YitT family protein [Lachnospiraceae bacterium]|nr:YitT family protein [Lachnospiraceae bacterium]MDD7379067.1 YitT family protein [Lachnospiraceae bacterium]MDY4616483.1 YitT family protein [Lachnospiraceae bacterium]MDY5775639.1 YitT family protein [Lachnospiraceae bacterium]